MLWQNNRWAPRLFRKEAAIADLALLACPGAEELCNLVDGHLVRWAREVGMNVDTFIIPSDCPRFQSPVMLRALSRLPLVAMISTFLSIRATTA